MYYPIAIEPGDKQHAFGVIVPDIPGCFSAGDTLDETLLQAEDAILLQLEGYLDNGQAFPAHSPLEALRNQPEYAGYIWSVCKVDISKLSDKAARALETMPKT
jgi:predicted RNase H-like HicB family nuclease